jgi:GNAT superfamily N-acetyltransferase
MSFALQKYIRRENKQIILASCHYDILEWLMPDWTCSPQKGGVLERCEYLRQGRPKIELSVSRVEYDTWKFFKKHHYLTEDVSKSFSLLLFTWMGKPVGIVVYKCQATGAVPNGYGLSRTVVLPDFQGIGIGSRISEFTAAILTNEGKRVFTKTVNPALGEHRNGSSNFKTTAKHGASRSDNKSDKKGPSRLSRPSYCHEYIGDPISGYEDLLLPINEMRKNKNNEISI